MANEFDPFDVNLSEQDLEERFRMLDVAQFEEEAEILAQPLPDTVVKPASEIPDWAQNYPPDSKLRGMAVEQLRLSRGEELEPGQVLIKNIAEYKLTLMMNFHNYVEILLLQEDNPKKAIDQAQEALIAETSFDLETDGDALMPLAIDAIKEISSAHSELITTST